MKVLKNETHVLFFLDTRPETRDDDMKLLACVISRVCTLNGELPSNISGFQLLKLFDKKWFPNAEGVTRCRRALQKKNPELRGKMYYKRRAEQEPVKKELGYGKT